MDHCSGSIALNVELDYQYRKAVKKELDAVRYFSKDRLAAEIGNYCMSTNSVILFLRSIGIMGGEPARITACKKTLSERLNSPAQIGFTFD